MNEHRKKMNCPDNDFLDFFETYDGEAIFLADWGFRRAAGLPANVRLCKKVAGMTAGGSKENLAVVSKHATYGAASS